MATKKPVDAFCMIHFKPAIIVLAALVVVVVAWSAWHCAYGPTHMPSLALAAATAPSGPPIGVKDKMLHPYWGNCNKCHVTVDAAKPVSKVMTGAPISIKQAMTHK
ncbi:MAG: magnetochrome domain-containing protein, partial [Deltaproteobacteria bacterium]|nr:magnetochrome domain-containing protein [Deltaproteobacteria bacterium]